MRVLYGAGDVVAALEAALERAKEGELDGVLICTAEADTTQTWGAAWRDNMTFPWARLLSSVATAHHELLTDGFDQA